MPGAQMRARLRLTDRKSNDRLAVRRAVADRGRVAEERLHGPGHEARLHQREGLPSVRLNARRRAGAENKEAERDRKQTDGGFRHKCCPFIGRPYLAQTRNVPRSQIRHRGWKETPSECRQPTGTVLLYLQDRKDPEKTKVPVCMHGSGHRQ